MRWPRAKWPEVSLHTLQGVPIMACILGYLSTLGEAKPSITFACMAICMVAFGEMVRRTEVAAAQVRQAAAQLGDVVHVGNGDPHETMRAAARWGSDILGRVARGEDAAEAVAGAALVQMHDAQSEAGSNASEQELNGFSNHYQPPRQSWIHNAIRSVTPDGTTGLSPRDLARMGTVPEDVPYHGQSIVRARPPVQRAAVSPPRVAAGAGIT